MTTPTCPPSTALFVRGGLLAASSDYTRNDEYARQWTIPSQSYDLTDAEECITEIVFTSADYYKAYLVLLSLAEGAYSNPDASDWKLRLRGTGSEFASSQEAEDDLVYYLTQFGYEDNRPWPKVDQPGWITGDPPSARPLAGLIVKNNGTIGTNNVLPIDRVNRGRSYLFMDVRPRWLSA